MIKMGDKRRKISIKTSNFKLIMEDVMRKTKKIAVLFLSVLFVIFTLIASSMFASVRKVSADAIEEVLAMSGLVSEEVNVNGVELEKTLVKAQLVHGEWGKYQAFDGMYDVSPDDEDQVYASDSVVQRGDEQGVSTYIKRYQISATTNNDAVYKFTFKKDARLWFVHGTFGGDFNNNWATHASWLVVQETADGAAIIKEMPTQSVTADNMYAFDVHGQAGDTIYVIYRMSGDTTVPGHNYANMFIDGTFIFKTADYSLEERDRIFAASTKIQAEEAYTMSSLVTEQVNGGISGKTIADVSLVHGKFGEYKEFEETYNAYIQEGAMDNDKVIASDSTVQTGDTNDKKTYIGRYILSATKENDAVFKFVFKQDAKLYINHGSFGGSFDNNWATHASFMIVQETAEGAFIVKEVEAAATVVANMFSGEVNGKTGDVVYVIYRMKGATPVPGHEYANIFLDYTFLLKEADYVENDRAEVLVAENIYKETFFDEKHTMSSIVSEVVRNGKVIRNVVDIELLHGVYGEYQDFDTFYNAIEDGGNDNWDEDRVSDSQSLAQNGSGLELATYFNRYKIGCTTNNDAVIKFTFKENGKIKVTHDEGFWQNWATHSRFYVVQVDEEGNSTNILIKNLTANIASNYYAFEVDGKKGDVVYFIYRMVGETTITGSDYANVGIDFNIDVLVNEYNETRREYCFENSVEDFAYEGNKEPDIEKPDDIEIEKPSIDDQKKGCFAGIEMNGVCLSIVLFGFFGIVLKRKRFNTHKR